MRYYIITAIVALAAAKARAQAEDNLTNHKVRDDSEGKRGGVIKAAVLLKMQMSAIR